jgi:CBS domain-containing membrane protein
VGIVSVPDFFIDRKNPQVQTVTRMKTASRVAEIMSTELHTAAPDRPLVELATAFSDLGLHHLPVTDPTGKLLGMVTQSDLVVALLAGRDAPGAPRL